MATKKQAGYPSFPALTKDDIELRAAQVGESNGRVWCSLLIYKDARVDQRMLDDAVGAMNWQKSYSRDNANCTVSIWDESKKQWISKEDTGTESQTEAEKGLASDSFKRACFAWGIGRELYGAPSIFIDLKQGEYTDKNGKKQLKTKFTVKYMEVDDAKINITKLVICDKSGAIRFQHGMEYAKPSKEDKQEIQPQPQPQPQPQVTVELLEQIIATTTTNELFAINEAHPELKDDATFKSALNNRWKAINNANRNAKNA